MNKFIRKSLEPGEEIVYNGRLHWSYIFCYLLWSFILLVAAGCVAYYGYRTTDTELGESGRVYYISALVLLAIALVVYIIGRIIRTRSEFVITATRFIQKDGIFDISMKEIPLFKVETVNYHQTFGQRIIGTGSIELVGSGGTNHSLHCIQHPMQVRRTIVSVINQQGMREDVPSAVQPSQPSAPATPAQPTDTAEA